MRVVFGVPAALVCGNTCYAPEACESPEGDVQPFAAVAATLRRLVRGAPGLESLPFADRSSACHAREACESAPWFR